MVLATIFTAMFMHGSLSHIFGNMLFLWVFGLQWLRKAILRAGGYIPLRDEAAIYRAQPAGEQGAHAKSASGMDWYAFTLAFKSVFLEGFEVAFIVLTFGTAQGNIPLAALGALLALAVVVLSGALLREPLSHVPETRSSSPWACCSARSACSGASRAWPWSGRLATWRSSACLPT